MKFIHTILCIVFILYLSINAQSVSARFETAFPGKGFNEFSGTGLGGIVEFEYPVSPVLAITGKSGYIRFSPRPYDLLTRENGAYFIYRLDLTYQNVPVKAGLKLHLRSGFFVFINAGMHIFIVNNEYIIRDGNYIPIEQGIETEAEIKGGFTMGAGYEIAVAPALWLTAGGKYHLIYDDLNYTAVNAGIKLDI